MFIHTVLFWAKDSISLVETEDFEDGLQSLRQIENIREFFIGTPADTDRPVIDSSYSYALIIHFDNDIDQNFYQEHQIHHEFIKNNSKYWSKVLVYDCITI
jgi:hypothetical protein